MHDVRWVALELWQSFPGNNLKTWKGIKQRNRHRKKDELNETKFSDILVGYADIETKGLLDPKSNGVTIIESTATWKSLRGGTIKFSEGSSADIKVGMNSVANVVETED